MKFEDIQIVWNEQCSEPKFLVDSAALYARLERDDIKNRRLQAFEEWMYSAMAAVVGILTISEPILENKEYHQLPLGVAFLLLSTFFLWKKVQRQKEEPEYEESFLGIIEVSISRLESYSRWVKRANLLFWFCTIVSALVTMFLYHDSKPVWLWFGLIAMMLASYIAVGKQLRNKAQGIRGLQALREQLNS